MFANRTNYWYPYRLFAFFSLFSLLALATGDLAFLWNLLFLLFLIPFPITRSENGESGLLPFINQDGHRTVRWHRLGLVWGFVIMAALLVCCAMAYVITGEWWTGALLGVAIGVGYAAVVTFDGFLRSVDELPSINQADL